MNVLVISGSMGSGKTTVRGEPSDLLADDGVPHAIPRPPVARLKSETVLPNGSAPMSRAEIELSSLQAVVGPVLKELLKRGSYQ